MLSDVDIDNLIQPFVDRQQDIENYVINTIAERVGEIGTLSKTDVYRLQQLYKIGSDVQNINSKLSKMLNIQQTQVKSMIKNVAVNTYKEAKPFYDYRRKSQIPYADNKRLQQSVNAVGKQTADTFKNLSNSKATGFYIRDAKHPQIYKYQSIKATYQSVVDEAIQSVQTGVLDFDTAMRRTLKQLNDSGIRRIYWESGYSRRLDSTVRMNVLSGIRQINQEVQKQIAEETNADGIELSAHSFSAPDHEPVQGHIFTLDNFDRLQSEEDFTDTYGNKFSAIRRPIGEWNCKHFTQAVVIAVHKPVWTLDELNELKQANQDGYTDKDGRHYTMYECTQVQRQYETNIRYAKEGYIMAKNANNEQLMSFYKTKVSDLNKQYNQFSKDCGLSKQNKRKSVSGYYV